MLRHILDMPAAHFLTRKVHHTSALNAVRGYSVSLEILVSLLYCLKGRRLNLVFGEMPSNTDPSMAIIATIHLAYSLFESILSVIQTVLARRQSPSTFSWAST